MAPMHDAHQRMASSIWFFFRCPTDGAVLEQEEECAVNVEMFAVCDGCDLDADGWFFLGCVFGGFDVTHGLTLFL